MPPTNTILAQIADNPLLFDALKALFLKQFDITGTVTRTDTNEVLGQQLRFCLEGREKVEAAFREIAQYKTKPSTPITTNQAR